MPNNEFSKQQMQTLTAIDGCLETIKQIKKYWINDKDENEINRHATMLLKVDYEKSLKNSYSHPKHLMYIFKINQMLNIVIDLFELPSLKTKLEEWIIYKDHEWKMMVFKTMVLMSDEIQMMIEQNWEFSSLAKVRQYFELYALYYLTTKYGAHVFDYFMSHGTYNMTKFIRFFSPYYAQKAPYLQKKMSNHQFRSPYGWMRKIKNIDREDRKIKHIIQQGIKNDPFLQHIYLNSNFPHHASSFMFASYFVKDEAKILQKHTKEMVFHTYLWLLDILISNFSHTFKNKMRKNNVEELKKIAQIFKILQRYINYAKWTTNNHFKKDDIFKANAKN